MDKPFERHLYTVEEVAERLSVHVKTVRRMIRDGRLRAKRIGKAYRIPRASLDEVAGSASTEGADVPRTRQVIASTIVDVDAIGPKDSDRITTLVMAGLNARKDEGEVPRVDSVYYADHGRLRIMITASPAIAADLLRAISALVEERRG